MPDALNAQSDARLYLSPMSTSMLNVAAHQKARFFERTPVPEWSPVSIIAGA